MGADALQVSIAPDLRALRQVRASLRAWLATVGVDEVDDVVLAVDEAVSNAVEHGHQADGDRDGRPSPITVTAYVAGDDMVQIEVRDHGSWRVPTPNGDRGRGIGIMRSIMDEVDVRSSATGTVVVMRRRRS